MQIAGEKLEEEDNRFASFARLRTMTNVLSIYQTERDKIEAKSSPLQKKYREAAKKKKCLLGENVMGRVRAEQYGSLLVAVSLREVVVV